MPLQRGLALHHHAMGRIRCRARLDASRDKAGDDLLARGLYDVRTQGQGCHALQRARQFDSSVMAALVRQALPEPVGQIVAHRLRQRIELNGLDSPQQVGLTVAKKMGALLQIETTHPDQRRQRQFARKLAPGAG